MSRFAVRRVATQLLRNESRRPRLAGDERFANVRDEDAFAELVARPGAAALRGGFAMKAVALAAAVLVACGVAFASVIGPASETPDSSNDPPAAAPKTNESAGADVPSEALPASAVARLGTVRLRTIGQVKHMAFSPDGTKLASWSGDYSGTDEFTVWDAKTGRALRRVDLAGATVHRLTWLADGRGIALIGSGGLDTVPVVWEFTDEKGARSPVKPWRIVKPLHAITGPSGSEPDNEYDACYTISPDGRVLATGKAGQLLVDREVQLWEVKTGVKANALRPLKGGVIHPGNCEEIDFTPDARTLVVFKQAKYLGNHQFERERLVTVWDVKTSREKVRFTAPCPATSGRPAVALSDTTLAIGLDSGGTSLWDLKTGKERRIDTAHASKKPSEGVGTHSVAFSPDGTTLATGGGDGATKLWDLASGHLRHTLAGHHTWVQALAVAPNGKRIASGGADGMIRLWDTATGADACPLPGHKCLIGKVVLSPDGKLAVTAGADGTLRWWDAATGAERRSVAVPGALTGLAVSPDGKTVLTGAGDGKLRMWDSETGREKPATLQADVELGPLSFTPDGKHLVAVAGPKVTIWEWPGLKLARTIDMLKPGPNAVPAPTDNLTSWCQSAAVSPDGKWLVTTAWQSGSEEIDGVRSPFASNGVADVWELASGKRVRRLAKAHISFRFGTLCSGQFRSGTFTTDGRFVLIGANGAITRNDGKDGESFSDEVNLLDPIAGRVVQGFDESPASGSDRGRYSGASALSPNGRTYYVSYSTGEIVGYEVSTGKPRRAFVGHRGYIDGLAFSADGRRLISGSHDGTALVWDATLAGRRAPRANPLTDAEVTKLWDTVDGNDARAAFAAMAELARSPDQAMEVLRRHVKPTPAAPTDATRVRHIRAVELLEGLGTPAARKLLTELAAGKADAPLTLDAAAALKRLGKP
ncbi:WD40 repeat domain-containing protein [Frigoriglobus tundricola]|uniref:WD40 repeat domain-containing protein n=1 Tax=Frigoriglobus tundricola TaxID=2774151 RepID=A0A6M5YRU2_9BACT|nr:WD40 repeat domain-containing protein [Frigoriglobus tundricola]QJW96076.1 hypothetical protein FTUN_3630 [Frigoriglobus tundricola]